MKKIFLATLLALTSLFVFANEESDTVRMKVEGKSARFSFTGTDNTTYYVDWGDGTVETHLQVNGSDKSQLKHTYTHSDTYSIKFWSERIAPKKAKNWGIFQVVVDAMDVDWSNMKAPITLFIGLMVLFVGQDTKSLKKRKQAIADGQKSTKGNEEQDKTK